MEYREFQQVNRLTSKSKTKEVQKLEHSKTIVHKREPREELLRTQLKRNLKSRKLRAAQKETTAIKKMSKRGEKTRRKERKREI